MSYYERLGHSETLQLNTTARELFSFEFFIFGRASRQLHAASFKSVLITRFDGYAFVPDLVLHRLRKMQLLLLSNSCCCGCLVCIQKRIGATFATLARNSTIVVDDSTASAISATVLGAYCRFVWQAFIPRIY